MSSRSKTFYERALAPLGVALLMEPTGRAAGLGKDGKPLFWLEDGRAPETELHVAFEAPDPATGRVHAAALEADGDNVEAICHAPASGGTA